MKSDELSSSPPLIENLAWNSKATGGGLIPVRIFPNESIRPNQKMLLAYDALVIGKLAGQIPAMGKLVTAASVRWRESSWAPWWKGSQYCSMSFGR